MKTKIKYLIILLWILLIGFLKLDNLIPININFLKGFLMHQIIYAALIFTGLWIVRLLALIPGVTLMVLGAMCFGPIYGFLLSLLGIIISESIVFLLAKTILSKKLNEILDKKYIALKKQLQKNNYKLLALGIICPIAPTDIVCFLSASSGIKFSTYIWTVAIANIPLMALYSSMGINFGKSVYGILLIVISIALVAIISIRIWQRMKIHPDNSM